MSLTKQEIAKLYKRRAGRYDITANLYYLVGFREQAYRKQAVNALALKQGDRVVEIGCGTGLNFGFLEKAVGPKGNIIGVDLTTEMLDQAEDRIRKNDWTNISLVEADAADYAFPEGVSGIISTFAITLIPGYDSVIRNGATALAPGERFAILDFRAPERWPAWFLKFWLLITKPFGVTLDLAERHPWESIERYLTVVVYQKLYFGLCYLCAGER